ncbi:MAG: hypothetical protein AAGD11_13820 [Planctomycetota bacterium]
MSLDHGVNIFRLRALAYVLFSALTIASAGCGEAIPQITIDNTGTSPLIVKIDGKTAAKVAPHEFQRIRLAPGKYQVEVKSNGQRLFVGQRIVEGSGSALAAKNYVFNPRSNRGYAVCKVVYGSKAFSDLTDEAIVTLAEYQSGKKVNRAKLEYMQVKRYAEPTSSTTWFALPSGVGYILNDPPQVAYTRGGSTSKRALTRISKADHAKLKKLHRIESPSAVDLDELKAVSGRALDSLSMLKSLQ